MPKNGLSSRTNKITHAQLLAYPRGESDSFDGMAFIIAVIHLVRKVAENVISSNELTAPDQGEALQATCDGL